MAKTQENKKFSSNWVIWVVSTLIIYSLGCYIPDIGLALTQPSDKPNSREILRTMSSPESNAVNLSIQQLIERQAKAWETADSEKIIADFAEDSLFIVPGYTFRGKQKIKEAAEGYFAKFVDTKITIKRVICNGNQGAVEWSWREINQETGEESRAEDAIIFELERGKIKYWREYIDSQSQGN